jgi:hypothetical protein
MSEVLKPPPYEVSLVSGGIILCHLQLTLSHKELD